MLRYLSPFKFSSFYHSHNFTVSPEHLQLQTCKLAAYVGAYRKYGHYYASLDPLSLYNNPNSQFIRPPDLQLAYQQSLTGFKFSSPITQHSRNIEQLQQLLREAYLGSTGVEFAHIQNLQEKQWLYSNYETLKLTEISVQNKVNMAKTLVQAEALDHYLHKKWTNFKRYSGQGAESTIVALNQLFRLTSEKGYEHLVFGMPHRGRLNLLVNILEYGARYLFRKISGKTDTPLELRNVIDDVTSHVAHSITKQYGQHKIAVSLVHNPSHLQAQNPVAMGKARSKLQLYGKDKVISVQVHGDAAVCAQGIVSQSLCLGRTPNFSVDGSIHIITNNQIGYTTKPIDSRPSKYATDLFKAYDIPIIHVNGQSIEDVYRAISLAVNYHSHFKKDILIDIICYRKYGHNEVDEPQFTQPKMYNQIRKHHQPNPKKYTQQLQEKNLLPSDFYETTRDNKFKEYETQFLEAQKLDKISLAQYIKPTTAHSPRAFTHAWRHLVPSQFGKESSTAFDIPLLKEFAKASCFTPSDFAVHSRIKKFHLEKRLKSIEENKLDWATCEVLAFFALNSEGFNVRLTGQDVQRGTFSQRHLNLIDQQNQKSFNPLEFFASQQPGRGNVEILNSALSENAVMSFQYGYSIDHPNNFALWQAQFGDFFNTAQVVIDVFLTNSENKWLRQSSLTLILPHGFDGMGPEHSSCRIERFLQMANSDGSLRYLQKSVNQNASRLALQDKTFIESIQDANFSVVAPSTPANLFHVLRRQMKRNFRKPLVISGPKTLLRHPSCVSTFQDLGPGTSFNPVLNYINCDRLQDCSVIFLVSGKYVYDVQGLIKERNSSKTCLMAIEELFPFPEEVLQQRLKGCSSSAQVYWIQEQNFNGGPYQFVENRVNRVLKKVGVANEVRYVGRKAAPSTAVGSVELHKLQTQQLTDWINQLII